MEATKSEFLPDAERLERATAHLGIATSELDWIRSQLEGLNKAYTGPTRETIQSFTNGATRAQLDRIAVDEPVREPLTYEEVGRLFVFAQGVAEDAERLAKDADAILDLTGDLFWAGHDAAGSPEVDDNPEWAKRRAADLRRAADQLEAGLSATNVTRVATEAIAGILAAEHVLATLSGDDPHDVSSFFLDLAMRLREQVFGEPAEDADFSTDESVVATTARANELAAGALAGAGFEQEARRHAETAKRIRELGSIHVPFRGRGVGR